ncbi:MAG: hypothetical protein ACI9EF_001026 [Pseudohongiellaceae bacterium]|jgi:hypothetical protein
MLHLVNQRVVTSLIAAAFVSVSCTQEITAQCSMDTSGYQYRVVTGHFSDHNTNLNHQNDMAMLKPTSSTSASMDVLAGDGFDEYAVNNYWNGALDVSTVTNRMVAGDFDGDGRRDDVAALQDLGGGATAIIVWKRLNSGSFADPVSYWSSTGYNANSTTGRVVSGDFDDDGKIDDIAAFYDYGGGETRIHVWLGTGTSLSYQGPTGWWSTTGYTASNVTNRVVSGDFDRDGNLDDIAAFYDYGNGQTRIHVWLRGSSSSFTYQSSVGWWGSAGYTAGRVTGRVVAGDFDRDGKYDDITAFYDYGPGAVRAHVWQSKGGSFAYQGSGGFWGVASGYTASALTGRIGTASLRPISWWGGYKYSTIIGVYDYGARTQKFHRWSSFGASFLSGLFGNLFGNSKSNKFSYSHVGLCN